MADIRIKDLATTASTTASDDFLAVDGTTNGTRKLSAATPSFATSVTVPGVAGPTATDLTLTGGSTGASLVLGQGATAGSATLSATGTGRVVTTPVVQIGSLYNVAGTLNTLATVGTLTLSDIVGFNLSNADGSRNLRASLFLDATNYRYGLQSVYSSASDFRFVIRQSGVDQLQVTQTGNLLIGGTTDIPGSGGLKVFGTTAASSTASGALQVAGGVGVAGNVVAGGFTFGTAPSASYPFYAASSTAGIPVSMRISHSDGTNATSNARIILDTASGGGDPFVNFISGAVEWSLGIDNSASDVFKLSRSGAIGTTDALTIDGSNAATFAGAVSVGGASAGAAQAEFRATSATTNAPIPVIGLEAMSSGTAVDGFGPAIDFRSENLAGTGPTIAGRIATVFKNTGYSNQEGEMSLWTASNNTLYRQLTLSPGSGAAGTSTFAGAVTVSSTTAGSAGAGALVVSGGLATGADSYIGGKLAQSVSAGTIAQSIVHTSLTAGVYQEWKTNTTTDRAYIGTANQVISGGSIADFAINSVTGNVVLGTASAARLTIGSAGATFAGAVAIGNTVNTVSPTSPNRTVTMVIGGVTYYLAAKTTND